jgi:hypothetical protein
VLAELAALSGELVPDGEQASLSMFLIPDDPAAFGEVLDVGDAGLLGGRVTELFDASGVGEAVGDGFDLGLELRCQSADDVFSIGEVFPLPIVTRLPLLWRPGRAYERSL